MWASTGHVTQTSMTERIHILLVNRALVRRERLADDGRIHWYYWGTVVEVKAISPTATSLAARFGPVHLLLTVLARWCRVRFFVRAACPGPRHEPRSRRIESKMCLAGSSSNSDATPMLLHGPQFVISRVHPWMLATQDEVRQRVLKCGGSVSKAKQRISLRQQGGETMWTQMAMLRKGWMDFGRMLGAAELDRESPRGASLI